MFALTKFNNISTVASLMIHEREGCKKFQRNSMKDYK